MAENGNKNFIIKVITVCAACIITSGVYAGYNSYTVYTAKVQHEHAQEYIQNMKDICQFKQMSDVEQTRLLLCKDDYVAAKQVLLSCVDTRINFWADQMTTLDSKFQELQQVKAEAPYWDSTLDNKYNTAKGLLVGKYKEAKDQHDFFIIIKQKLSLWTPSSSGKPVAEINQTQA